MADSSVTFQSGTAATPPAATVVSTRTNASSEQMEVVVVGIDGSDSIVGSDTANGLDVDVTRVQGSVTVVQGTAANLKVDASGVAIPAAQSGTWTVQPGNTANTTAWKVDGSAVTQPVSGTVSVNALPAGTNNIGDVDVLSLPAIPTGANVVGQVGLEPRTSGGLSISRTLSAASTNATSVKASAGQVFGYYLFNANAATRYLKLYNKASSPTVGTDTPVATIPIPAGAAANVEFTQGVAFATGIALALTTGIADADTGAVAANEVVVNLFYK